MDFSTPSTLLASLNARFPTTPGTPTPNLKTLVLWSTSETWEHRASSLYFLLKSPPSASGAPEVSKALKHAVFENLGHPEPRVRTLAAEACGELVRKEQRENWETLKEVSIKHLFLQLEAARPRTAKRRRQGPAERALLYGRPHDGQAL